MSSIGLSFGESLADERPRSLTSAVQERLRADILSTRLLPGQKLHIAGLAKQFSVSLAAVREALSRLVADGTLSSTLAKEVFAEMLTGVANATCCQPELVSLMKTAEANRVPLTVHRLPKCVPVLVGPL